MIGHVNADDLLRAYVLEQFRDEYDSDGYAASHPREVHIARCEEASVLESDGRDGSYGCETGCEWLTLEASISCPHGEPVEYEYGEFGDIPGLIWSLEKMAARGG